MSDAPEVDAEAKALRPRWLVSFDPHAYALTRFVFLRFLGLMYLVAFLVARNQLVPLVGAEGLEPADRFLAAVKAELGPGDAFVRLPTLFWFGISDGALYAVAFAGVAVSALVLAGFANSIALFFLWLFYL